MGCPNKPGPCGVIVIDKPPGLTSMAAVAAVRRRAGGAPRPGGAPRGPGGHCRSLRRLAVGPFTEEEARRPEDLPAVIRQGDVIAIQEGLPRVGGNGPPSPPS